MSVINSQVCCVMCSFSVCIKSIFKKKFSGDSGSTKPWKKLFELSLDSVVQFSA